MLKSKNEMAICEKCDRVEVRHGRWEKCYQDKWRCSECEAENNYAYLWNVDTKAYILQDKYCPNCGSRMDGDEE